MKNVTSAVLTIWALALLCIFSILGCKSLPPVTVCYDSPKWGHICVTLGSNGDKTIIGTAKPLTDAELAAAKDWVKAQK